MWHLCLHLASFHYQQSDKIHFVRTEDKRVLGRGQNTELIIIITALAVRLRSKHEITISGIFWSTFTCRQKNLVVILIDFPMHNDRILTNYNRNNSIQQLCAIMQFDLKEKKIMND